MSSLKRRLQVGIVLGVVPIFALFGLAGESLSSSLIEAFDARLLSSARAVASLVRSENQRWKISFDSPVMSEFEDADPPAYFQIRDARKGQLLLRSESLGEHPFFSATASFEGQLARELTLGNGRRARGLQFSFSAASNGDAPVILHVARELGPLQTQLDLIHSLAIGGTVLGALLVCLIVTLVIRRGLSPLDELGLAVARIGPEDLDTRFDTAGMPTELLPLGEALNGTFARLREAFERERRFTGDVAHELRTPIAGLRSTIEVIRSRPRDVADYREALDDCLEIALQLEGMVASLLTLERLDAGLVEAKLTSVCLSTLVTEQWAALDDESATSKLAPVGELGTVSADRSLLSLIVGNLLGNAAAYGRPDSAIEVRSVRAGEQVELKVRNSMAQVLSQDAAERVFDRFWRGDAARTAGDHAGLGLALVRRAAESMGGSAKVEITGEDFIATVTLPSSSHESTAITG